MKKHYNISLFIFRRDLRLDDNIALIHAISQSNYIIPCFIFDPRQIGKTNQFKSNNCIQFMIESLCDLEQQLIRKKGQLYYFYGKAEDVIKKIISQVPIDALFLNRDYTSFSLKRDDAIKKVCNKNKILFHSYDSLLLTNPDEVKTINSTPYSIFTAYYKRVSKEPVEKPRTLPTTHWYTKHIGNTITKAMYKKIASHSNKHIAIHGGRKNGIKIIRNLRKFKNYTKERDYPALNATTHLSAHIKFGTLSLREIYYAIKKQLGAYHPLLRQLYWHDFFTYVAYHSPFVFGNPYHEQYKKLWWSKNKKHFAAWCKGKTGFPLVDAGMRQLNTTGFMHNRVRMVVASFLTKDLHIDWQWGEKYFAQKLVDYDPAVNNGNWQWCASTGCDAQPYFRIFNPWIQQKKFDPDCVYIKQWIPELKTIQPAAIHTWFNDSIIKINYPKPIIDHAHESKIAKQYYKKVHIIQ